MRVIAIIFAYLMLTMPIAIADEASHEAAAEELLILTGVDKSLDQVWDQMEMMMKQQYDQMRVPVDSKVVFEKYREEMLKVYKEEFSWEKLKGEYIDMYKDTFSEEELKAVSEFYKSPAGKIYVQKTPELIRKSMALSQKKMPAYMERMNSVILKMRNEIKGNSKNKYMTPEASGQNNAQSQSMTKEELDEELKSK